MSYRTASSFAWVPRFAVRHVMKVYPYLPAAGFSSPRAPDFDAARTAMLTDAFVHEVDRAEYFLRAYGKTKTLSMLQTSYGLKHRAERCAREAGADWGDCYVSNGALIVAGVLHGFVVKRVGHSSLNAYINISKRPRFADPGLFRHLDDLPCGPPLAGVGGCDNVVCLFPRRGNSL
jgi:hypothetical protein